MNRFLPNPNPVADRDDSTRDRPSASWIWMAGFIGLLSSCENPVPASVPTPQEPQNTDALSACPSEAMIQELHASTFYFEHGSVEDAKTHLKRADALAATSPVGEWTEILKTLHSISTRADTKPRSVAAETEELRAFLSYWHCLPGALHKRFHQGLPSPD